MFFLDVACKNMFLFGRNLVILRWMMGQWRDEFLQT